MKIMQASFSDGSWNHLESSQTFAPEKAQLVLVFGERMLLEEGNWFGQLKTQFPTAQILLCSTSGEIFRNAVQEGSLVYTAIEFENTRLRTAEASIQNHHESYEAGKNLSAQLIEPDLKLIFVLSDGSRVNGSALIEGLNENLDPHVTVSGGLAGDGARFEKTLVGLNHEPKEGAITAIGFYGDALKIGHGTMGGWDVFGPERQINKSSYNVLYEFGGKKALDLYKDYLGKYASELPGAALLFPLSLRTSKDAEPIVRTILSVNESDGSMVFAGDMPEGAYVNLMKANFDRLIDAAATASEQAMPQNTQPELAILVSCVGRRLALGQRIDEEIESAREILGSHTVLAGFYSYGEISPLTTGKCELHNQTMTVTTLTEMV